jgi:plastocyanin
MRHLVLLSALYVLIVALVLPSSLFASDQPPAEPAASAPAGEEAAAAPAEEPVAPEAPEETTPAEEAPAPEVPAETTPEAAPAPATTTAPAEPAPEAEEQADEPAAAPAKPAKPAKAEDAAEDAKGKKKKQKKSVRAKAAADQTVTIADYEFTPADITVQQGDEVTWVNDGPSDHSATADDGSFDTGIFPAGERRSVTFEDVGTFTYICTPHPQMEGTVVVEAAGSLDQAEEDLEDAEDDLAAAEDELDAADGLPDTGRDARVIALTGLLILMLGVILRLRARPQE